MLLIYIMSGHTGHKNATYRLPNNHQLGNADVSVLSYTTAPRAVQDISANGAIRGPSYHYKHNPVSRNVRTKYNEDQLDPLPSNFTVTGNNYTVTPSGLAGRPTIAPYYLFFGKFASQSVSNLQPKFTGHLDEIGQTQNQQPSNIYNIPDYPKNYTLYEATGTTIRGPGDKQDMPTNLATATKIIYDASSCPVNWRMFGPIQKQVLDWSANGVIGGGGGSLNAGLYDISSNGSFFFVSNPAKRDISGIYFDTNDFDLSFNPATNSNAYISIKGGGGGSGTDLSFNNYFFKQPGMPYDCSAVFVNANPKRLELSWDIPFNRLSGTTFTNGNPRFFCKNDESENWLPAFNDFILDISGVVTGAPLF